METDSAAGRRQHWEARYRGQAPDEVSWFQRDPAMSLRLLAAAGLGPHTSVVDVGGGASTLADRLLDLGVPDITVLDLAAGALRESRDRLGPAGAQVTWLAQDLLQWRPVRRYDLWHDRAMFHFLTEPGDRARYAAVLDEALGPDGSVVIATFAEDGPEYCSGLPVVRYREDELARQFPDLHPVRAQREEHRTPAGAIQPFTWLVLSRQG